MASSACGGWDLPCWALGSSSHGPISSGMMDGGWKNKG